MTVRRRAWPSLLLGLTLLAGPALSQPTSRSARADFDGDGRMDQAAIEVGPRYFEVAVRLAGKGRYVVESGRAQDAENLYLQAAPPGVYQDVCLDEDDIAKCPPVTVKHSAIEFGAQESASSIIYWDGKRFKQLWTSD
jgi:hypothetical protein